MEPVVDCRFCDQYNQCGCPATFAGDYCKYFNPGPDYFPLQEAYCREHSRDDNFIYCDDCKHQERCGVLKYMRRKYPDCEKVNPYCMEYCMHFVKN